MHTYIHAVHVCCLTHEEWFINLGRSLAVCPIREEHEAGVRELVASLSASADILVDVHRCLEAGRDPLDEVGKIYVAVSCIFF